MTKENILYYTMLLAGAIFAIGIWVFNVRKSLYKKDFRTIYLFSLTLPTALVLSFITVYILNSELHNFTFLELIPIIGKEYFITLFYFSVLSSIMFWVFSLKFSEFNAAAPPLALFSVIARIGCMIAGCCDGIHSVPIRELEILFGIAAFVYLQFFCRKQAFLKYLVAYSFFRLITQFFRAEPAPYYIVQIYAIVLIIFAAVFYFRNRSENNEKIIN